MQSRHRKKNSNCSNEHLVLLTLLLLLITSNSTNVGPKVLKEKIYVGWRSSIYGCQQDQSPQYWVNTANMMSSKITNSTPSGIWIIGTSLSSGNCYLTFPSPGGSQPNIVFDETDLNEKYLKAFDANGIKVWLEVEPSHANVTELIDLVLTRYSNHTSVIGFGIDVEWLEPLSHKNGRRVTDEEAITWLLRVKSYNPNFKFFLKHWLTNKMPTINPKDLVFIDDSQGFYNLDSLMNEFKQWGSYFAPSNVSFQIGYSIDRRWWSQLEDPSRNLGNALVSNISNCEGIYWVDFTILEIFSPFPADLNGDGTVNILDLAIVARAFGSEPNDPNWNQIADLNNDKIINIVDLSTVAMEFGKTV